MRGLKTWAWAAAIAVATASPAFAQLTTTTIGGAGTTGGTRTVTGTGGINSGGGATTGGFGGGGTGGGAGTGSGAGGNLQQQLATMESAPNLGAPLGTTSSSVDPVLGRFYGNPYYQGRDHTARNVAPGGFGTVLYTSTSNRGTGTVTGGRAGATGALGGRGTLGGQNANQSGILIPLPVQINYTAQMQFPTPAVPATRMQTDLRGIIDSGGLSNSKGVEIVVMADNNVRLRGTVKDGEEARLVEGLVRLTPGVGSITNELTFPVASK